LNILIFIHSLSSGGAERVTVNLANHWADKGWQVTIVTLASESLDFYQLDPAVRRIVLNLAGDSSNPLMAIVNNLRRAHALRRVLRNVQPEVSLAMMTTANILLALATLGLPQFAAIGSERVHPPQYSLGPLWEWLRSHAYGNLAAVTALTNESRAWLLTHTHARKVTVIPNPAPWPLPVQAPLLSVQSANAAGRKTLLAVGRLNAQKGFDLLITVFAEIAIRHQDWDLVILGEGPLRAVLEQQVTRTGLSQRIKLPGRAGNVADWYAAADIYVMSSRFEGFPNTLAEAMAHGLPAVSFDCDTGPRDIIRHAVDGLLVPNGDEAALRQALSRLMADDALRLQFAAKAKEVRERFSMQKIAAMWEALFKEVRR
jgi:glycosyltransferase involved in cell wall biosynthesis